MGTFLRPLDLEESLAALAATPLTILAGGTDFYPAHVGTPVLESILDVTRIPSLRGVTETDGAWRVGGATTWTDLTRAPLEIFVMPHPQPTGCRRCSRWVRASNCVPLTQ